MPTSRNCRRVVVLLCAGLSACLPAMAASPDRAHEDPVREVNTFIGTQDEGNTFPGASAPFGMIQVSPITGYYAGYRHGDPKIRGFGHSFVSGAGCWEQGGQVARCQCRLRPVADQQGAAGQGEQAEPAAEKERQVTQRGGAQQEHGQESGQFDARSLRPALSLQREASVKKM